MKRCLLGSVLLCAAAAAGGCNLEPLSSTDLDSLRPPPAASCGTCASDQVCDPERRQCVPAATLTGGVVSACTGLALSARVTIDGKSTCSTTGKAYFRLQGLRPGGPQRLAVGKEGYAPASQDLVLEAGFNALGDVALSPARGCGAAVADVPCSCTSASCQ